MLEILFDGRFGVDKFILSTKSEFSEDHPIRKYAVETGFRMTIPNRVYFPMTGSITFDFLV